jgi:hypothetical protein
LMEETDYLCKIPIADSIFLGCKLQEKAIAHIQASGGVVFPDFSAFPYKAFRSNLYTPEELMAGYDPKRPKYCTRPVGLIVRSFFTDTLDSQIYHHFDSRRKDPNPLPVLELIGQRLHDTSMDHALEEFLSTDNRKLRSV